MEVAAEYVIARVEAVDDVVDNEIEVEEVELDE